MTKSEHVVTPGALDGIRVLELASPMTQYCGKMFAELGAEITRLAAAGVFV